MTIFSSLSQVRRYEEQRTRLGLVDAENVIYVFANSCHLGPRSEQPGDLVLTNLHLIFVGLPAQVRT